MARALVFGSLISLSFPLYGTDFSVADGLFAKRSEGLFQASLAKNEYRKLLPSLASDQEKIYAVGQMSRLDIYVGGMMPGLTQDQRNDALDDCIANVAQIASTKSQEYYYYYLSCIGIRGKQASVMQRLKYGLMMRNIQDEALTSTRDAHGQLVGGYEAGGILRVFSAVRANPKAKPLGLYNAQEGVDYANSALNTAKQRVHPYGELSGRDYFENYFYLAAAEVNLGIDKGDLGVVKQGQNTAVKALQKISDLRDFGELPPGRDPETTHYESELQGLQAAIGSCVNESDWKACLSGKLN